MTKRVAISLPDGLYQQLERVRKRRRAARSTVIQEAVGEYLKRNDEKALEEQYFDGYRRIPDGDDPDFIAWEKAAIEDMAKRGDEDEWPDPPSTVRSGGRARTKSVPSSSRRAAIGSGSGRKSRAHR